MASLPLMTVSGIRGVYGDTLTDDFAARVAYTQTKLTKASRVVVGRDTRPSGAALAKAIFRGIRAAGATPVDIGIAPTPTTCLAVPSLNAQAGVIITASHNPIPYNGYKMVHASGRLCNDAECATVYRGLAQMPIPDDALRAAPATPGDTADAAKMHVERILGAVDVAAISRADISIAIDSINGAGGAVFPLLLDKLKVKWVGVNNKLDGNFTHNPEPRPEHLVELAALLKGTRGLWAGFAFDPDADRLAPMGEHGEPISEEMTLALALDNLLSKKKTAVATNLSTSMVIDDVARKYGVTVYRTKIGEANVVEGMLAHGCEAGGEGNGGVIYPRVSTVRDGLTALALIVELMAKTGKTLTALAAQWPTYAVVKEKIPAPDGNGAALVAKLAGQFAGEQVDLQDGVKIIRKTSWVHLRPSNTEPILRCYAEAATTGEARALVDLVTKRLNGVGR
jgi:phosphomannomutase